MNVERLAFLFALGCSLGAPRLAAAESGLLLGFSGGLAVARTPGQPAAFFRAGVTADFLQTSGLAMSARAEATHLLDATFTLGLGWRFRGMLEDEGAPVALALGPAVLRDHDGGVAVGGRAELMLGLWLSRVALAADCTALKAVWDEHARGDDIVVAVSLRFAPWPAFRL